MFLNDQKTRRRVLIIEFMNYHGWLSYVPCLFLLDAGYDVTVLISDKNRDKDIFLTLGDRVTLIEFSCGMRPACFLKWLWWVNRQAFELVFIMTLQTYSAIWFAALLRHRLWFAEHHVGTENHFTGTKRKLFQWVQRKADRILLLSEHIYRNAADRMGALKSKTSWFDPGYLLPEARSHQDHPSGERIIFIVPGALEKLRRNYSALMDTFERIAHSPLIDRIEIYLKGDFMTPIGRDLILRASDAGLMGKVIRLQSTHREPFLEYLGSFASSHFMLPLLDNTCRNNFDFRYNIDNVPSSLILSRMFGLPIVNADSFPMDDDLKPYTIAFADGDLFGGLERAVALFDGGDYAWMRAEFEAHTQRRYAVSRQAFWGDVVRS